MVFLLLNYVIMIKDVDMTSIYGFNKGRGALLNNTVGFILQNNSIIKITHISTILAVAPKGKLPAPCFKNVHYSQLLKVS